MKSQIVADGEFRLRRAQEQKMIGVEFKTPILARYSEELERAGCFRGFLLRRRIAAEWQRERRKIEPSKYSLYGRSFTGR